MCIPTAPNHERRSIPHRRRRRQHRHLTENNRKEKSKHTNRPHHQHTKPDSRKPYHNHPNPTPTPSSKPPLLPCGPTNQKPQTYHPRQQGTTVHPSLRTANEETRTDHDVKSPFLRPPRSPTTLSHLPTLFRVPWITDKRINRTKVVVSGPCLPYAMRRALRKGRMFSSAYLGVSRCMLRSRGDFRLGVESSTLSSASSQQGIQSKREEKHTNGDGRWARGTEVFKRYCAQDVSLKKVVNISSVSLD